jgi:acetyl esterase/lipase
MSKLAVVLLAAVCVSGTGVAAAQEKPKVVVKPEVIYGQVAGSALLADLAYPERGDKMPAIMYVHGGRWQGGTRTDASSKRVAQWADAGYFTMAIDYRLVGASPAPAGYEDLLCAIRWLHAHAAEYRVDEDRVYLIGPSSGGHFVSLIATLGEGPYKRTGGWDNARSDVRAVISVSGAYDLKTLSWGNLWTPLSGDVEEARQIASPLRHIGPNTRPILLLHSDDDRSVQIDQAVEMAKALDGTKVLHKFVHYKDRGHMQVTDEVAQEARAFIAEVEKQTTSTR